MSHASVLSSGILAGKLSVSIVFKQASADQKIHVWLTLLLCKKKVLLGLLQFSVIYICIVDVNITPCTGFSLYFSNSSSRIGSGPPITHNACIGATVLKKAGFTACALKGNNKSKTPNNAFIRYQTPLRFLLQIGLMPPV